MNGVINIQCSIDVIPSLNIFRARLKTRVFSISFPAFSNLFLRE